jgi:hypothetical protein
MNKLIKSISIASLAAMMGLGSMASANAMPLPAVHGPQISDVEQVQYRNDRRVRREWRDGRRGWHHGHRGYREYRRGYRRHSDGWWYPLAAFGAGAVIGGAVASPPRAYAGSSAHVQWCSQRYRTYRASDNTYVPSAGVRAQCNSPYN